MYSFAELSTINKQGNILIQAYSITFKCTPTILAFECSLLLIPNYFLLYICQSFENGWMEKNIS